jgi:predicted permease
LHSKSGCSFLNEKGRKKQQLRAVRNQTPSVRFRTVCSKKLLKPLTVKAFRFGTAVETSTANHLHFSAMLTTYFKTAIRNLRKNSKHALINMLGLGVAIAACIIVFLVIQYEISYDKHLADFKEIYQVVTTDKDADGEHFTNGVPFPTIKHLRQDYPQFQFAELMQNYGIQVTVHAEGTAAPKKFREETGVFYGDPELLNIFELKWLSGQANVLKDLNSVVLSQSQAAKYFGEWKQAVGKTIELDNNGIRLQVAGIFEDVPQNSDFPFAVVGSYAGFAVHDKTWPTDDWGANTSNHQVYVKIPTATATAAFSQYLLQFQKKYNKNNLQTTRTHLLHPLTNVHFDERFATNGDHVTSKSSLYTLAFIGVLIILMACINFINLSTALSVSRSKEVGIRKVMGSNRNQLRLQVYAETATIVVAAMFIGLALAILALPFVKSFMVVQQKLSVFNLPCILFLIAITATITLISGWYPALIMGGFKPVEAIKNKINTSKVGSVSLRRVLVVLQFAFSQILVIATIIAVSQMNYIKSSDLGFNQTATLVVYMNADSVTRSRHEAFANALQARSDVKSVSFGFDPPSSENSWGSNFAFDEMKDRDFAVQLKMADHNYASTYGLQLAAGSFYHKTDTTYGYVVNETLLKKCNVTQPKDAIGKMFRLGGREPMPVIGVVKDFKQASLRDAIAPIVMLPNKRYYQSAGIKLSGTNLGRTKDEVKAIWDKNFPEYVYNAAFLEDNIKNFYAAEERLSAMYKVYAALAIFISCLGLYGLVSYMVVRKTKEVGIRKVLGASVQSILYLFSKEFTILIAIAFVLAAPVAWWMMNNWLRDYEFKIEIGAGVFFIAIVCSMLVAWITVGYKAFKAAVANPVKSIRTE